MDLVNQFIANVEDHWVFWLLFGPELLFFVVLPFYWLGVLVYMLGLRATTGHWPWYEEDEPWNL